MKNELMPFEFEKHDVRIIKTADSFWVVAKDVIRALEYPETSNPARLCHHVPAEWKGVKPFHTLGGVQEMLCLSEQGLYFLLGRSDKAKAVPFQKKVAGEILPEIRKTGALVPEGMDLVNKAVLKSSIQNLVAYSHLRIEVDAFKKALVPHIKDDREALEEIARHYRITPSIPQLETLVKEVRELKEAQNLYKWLAQKIDRLEKRGTRITDDEIYEIRSLSYQNYSVSRIAEKTGRSPHTVRKVIESHFHINHAAARGKGVEV
jgi:prophage antirepressor-like protein